MTSQHLIHFSITGKAMHVQIFHLPLLEWTLFCGNVSNPMIQSHYHQSIASSLHMIKHWICASEVSLTETNSKAVGNWASDVEGEWNCSHIHCCIKGKWRSVERDLVIQHVSHYYDSVMNIIINVKLQSKLYHNFLLTYFALFCLFFTF